MKLKKIMSLTLYEVKFVEVRWGELSIRSETVKERKLCGLYLIEDRTSGWFELTCREKSRFGGCWWRLLETAQRVLSLNRLICCSISARVLLVILFRLLPHALNYSLSVIQLKIRFYNLYLIKELFRCQSAREKHVDSLHYHLLAELVLSKTHQLQTLLL